MHVVKWSDIQLDLTTNWPKYFNIRRRKESKILYEFIIMIKKKTKTKTKKKKKKKEEGGDCKFIYLFFLKD